MLIFFDSLAKCGAVLALIAPLSGCVSPGSPPSPSDAMQRLMFACDEGDTNACQAVAADEASRRQEALIMTQNRRPNLVDPTLFIRPPAPVVGYYNRPGMICLNGAVMPPGMLCPI